MLPRKPIKDRSTSGRGTPRCPVCESLIDLKAGRYSDFTCDACGSVLQVDVSGHGDYESWTWVQ